MKQENSTTAPGAKHRVVANGVWMMANSVATRVVGLVGQFVLAWLLVPEDFGLIALAGSTAMLVDLVSQFGLSDVLISRYRRIHLWRPAAFSISMILGLAAAGVMLLIAVGASIVYADADLGWIIAIMAIAAPIRAIGIVPYTQLRAEMRYRPIAIVQSLSMVLNMVAAIVLAIFGLGAYSFAWAKVVSSISLTLGWILITKIQFPSRYTLRGAKYLIADSLHGYAASFCGNVVQLSDYLILGLFVALEEVGAYFLAFTISVQAISLIAMNLSAVLFPEFSALSQNPKRQTAVFIRSTQMLAFVSMPVCFLQALVAAPLIPLILEPKWHSVVPLIQILSLGTTFRCVSYSWSSLLKSQRRFSTASTFSVLFAAVFPCAVALSSYLGGVLGCAIGVSVYSAVVSILQLYVAIRSEKGALKKVLDLCLRPFFIASVAFGGAGLMATSARNAGMPIVEIVIIVVAGLALYWGLSSKINLVPINDAKVVLQRIRSKLTPPRPAASERIK